MTNNKIATSGDASMDKLLEKCCCCSQTLISKQCFQYVTHRHKNKAQMSFYYVYLYELFFNDWVALLLLFFNKSLIDQYVTFS